MSCIEGTKSKMSIPATLLGSGPGMKAYGFLVLIHFLNEDVAIATKLSAQAADTRGETEPLEINVIIRW